MPNVVLITGAAGWLGGLLAHALRDDPKTPDVQLILADIVEPKAPDGNKAVTIKADLTDKAQVEALFDTPLGIPDTVYCMHGIMSRGSEDDFELGLKVNIDSVRLLLETTRQKTPPGQLIKFIFTSSLAVYGGPLPEVVTPSTIATPEGAYGMGKLTSELLVNEYTRRGFIDGRILRLPTVVVRPGPPPPPPPPSSPVRGPFSPGCIRIIREPLKGLETTCPIGDSLASPELDSLAAWLASPQTTVRNFVIAKHVPASAFYPHTRVVYLPGFTATVRDELDALEKVAGKEVVQLVKFKDDPVNRRIVKSWPAKFDIEYPLSLGFVVDEGGMEPIVRQFKKDVEEGRA
ncbi:putative rmlD substrate binding domain containing protein [Lyophyllum shimeji]|uniref:RmlD substrate binding domain containing protein n=1 Tax=Lyophyllum shimeji TaxID=47721 RepID=A0A9P3PVR8_LYOSH|nr:putative rmlD substrate binding domain containing protein [Lyophyllum shimeji]